MPSSYKYNGIRYHVAPLSDRTRIQGLSRSLVITLILTAILSYFVYYIPVLSGEDLYGTFDAFNYPRLVNINKDFAVSFQRFLILYPERLPSEYHPFYAIALHFCLMLPIILTMRFLADRSVILPIFLALLIPESTIFTGAVSKEGITICAVLAGAFMLVAYSNKQSRIAFFLFVYAIALAELSRPSFGAVFSIALLVSLIPMLSRDVRSLMLLGGLLFFIFLVVLLFGPLYPKFLQVYQDARSFLFFFESDFASNSPLKAAIRGVFLIAFNDDIPSFFFIFIAILFAFIKSIIYLFAVPIVALPDRISMPFFTWALSWQVATSMSSFCLLVEFVSAYRNKYFQSRQSRAILTFGFMLLFLLAISTAIFHVRYRAPAVVALFMACWVARSEAGLPVRRYWILMQALTIGSAVFAIIATR